MSRPDGEYRDTFNGADGGGSMACAKIPATTRQIFSEHYPQIICRTTSNLGRSDAQEYLGDHTDHGVVDRHCAVQDVTEGDDVSVGSLAVFFDAVGNTFL